MGDGRTNTPCDRVACTGMLKAQENISAETAKDAESLRQTVEYGPAPVQEIQTTSDGHVVIDPAVRERIANPKCPVRMPERPFESLRFHDFTRRENCGKRRNKSRVNGLFGREWREEFDKKQQREFAKEDKETINRNKPVLSFETFIPVYHISTYFCCRSLCQQMKIHTVKTRNTKAYLQNQQ